MDGRGGQASAIALVFGETLVEAAFMDERTNKDQRPRCFRIETAADQERNETRGWREGPRTAWGPPRWTPSGVSGRRVSGASAGVFHSRHPRQEYRRQSFGLPPAPAGGRVKGEARAICGKFRAVRHGTCAPRAYDAGSP